MTYVLQFCIAYSYSHLQIEQHIAVFLPYLNDLILRMALSYIIITGNYFNVIRRHQVGYEMRAPSWGGEGVG